MTRLREVAELRERVEDLQNEIDLLEEREKTALIVDDEQELRVLLRLLEFHEAGEGTDIDPILDDLAAGRIRDRLQSLVGERKHNGNRKTA